MRAIAISLLASGLLLAACGSDDSGPTAPGVVNPARTGGSSGRGSGGSTGSGGSSMVGTGGSATGTGGSVSSGGSTAPGSGGGTGASDAATDTTSTPTPATDGPVNLGGLGPGSADDSAPLVLPGSKLIFDGTTLNGWMPCDPKFWTVKDAAINGDGSGNNFCLTATDHDTFRITGKSRMVRDPSNHAGICIWGGRAAGGGGCLQMTPVSGSLWDYGGGGGVRTLPRTRDYTKWNFFEILVDLKTGNIDIAVEGQAYPTYKDKSLARRKKGPIGLQLHAGSNQVQYKDLALEDNPTNMKLLTVKP